MDGWMRHKTSKARAVPDTIWHKLQGTDKHETCVKCVWSRGPGEGGRVRAHPST